VENPAEKKIKTAVIGFYFMVWILSPGFSRDGIGFTGPTGARPLLGLDPLAAPTAAAAARTAHGIIDGGNHSFKLLGFAFGTIQ